MLFYVTFVAAVILAAATDENDWKTETTTRTKTFVQNEDHVITEEHMRGPGNRIEQMEREMTKLREVVLIQGEIMQEAKQEINQLKDTIQRQTQEMKFMTEKQEGIIIKQGLKLKSHEKDVKALKLSVQKQEKQITLLKKHNSILKNVLIKQCPDTLEDSTKKTETKCLQRDKTAKEIVEESDIPHNEDNTDLTKSDKMKIKTVPNRIPHRNTRAGFQGLANETGIAFSAYLSHYDNNMGIGHTIKCDKVLINDGNAYSSYTGTFTVPETGVYFLTFHIDAWALNDETIVKLVVNNRNIVDADVEVKGTTHHESSGNSAIIRLNSGEKVWLEIYTYTNVQLDSTETYRFVTFSGYMLY